MNNDKDTTEYCVVVNEEGQYSIWPAERELPRGWFDVGTHGSKEECLAHIDEVWTDMRPLSLVNAMRADKQDT
jgi:MbtH protein